MIGDTKVLESRSLDTCSLRGNADCGASLDTMNNPVFKMDCCTLEKPCGLGEGSCNSDGDCMSSLVCGKNNCNKTGGGLVNCCVTMWERPGSYQYYEYILLLIIYICIE